MKTVSLSGAIRTHVGKKDAKKNRREGKIPCVLYGGKEQVHLSIPMSYVNNFLYTPNVYFININLCVKVLK